MKIAVKVDGKIAPIDAVNVTEDVILKKIKSWCIETHLASTMIGVGDDAAAVFPSGRPLFFCSDFTIENTHFEFRFSKPADVGYKSLTRPVSDIAAMGAEPLGVMISIAVPRAWDTSQVESFIEDYFRGATLFSRDHRTPILGGDLSRTDGALVVDVSAIGQLRTRGSAWRRSGARPNDLAFVTGPLGAASFSLLALREGREIAPDVLTKHLRPRPRLDVSESLCQHPVTAAIDISDGLVRDAKRLCEDSNVSLELIQSAIPGLQSFGPSHTLSGGDDYELLLAISEDWARSDEGATELQNLGAVLVGQFKTITDSSGPAVYFASDDGSHPRRVSADEFLAQSHDPFRDIVKK